MIKNINTYYKFLKKNYKKDSNDKIKKFFTGLNKFYYAGNHVGNINKYNFNFGYKLKFAAVFIAVIFLLFISFFPYLNKIYIENEYKRILYNELIQSNNIIINDDFDVSFSEIVNIDNYLLFNNGDFNNNSFYEF